MADTVESIAGAIVRRELTDDVDLLDAGTLDAEIAATETELLARYPCCASLSGDDVTMFGRALGYLVTARVAQAVQARVSGGAVREKTGTSDVQYAPVAPAQLENWLKEAANAVRLVACVAAAETTGDTGLHLFGVVGPTRSAVSAYGITSTIDALRRIYALPWAWW